MVKEQVEKTMKKALMSIAKKEGKTAKSICVFIHTKPTKEEPECRPKYFYSVDGNIVKGEDGKTKELYFVRDILGVKFDLLGMEALAINFFAQYFKNKSEELKTESKSLYIMITSCVEDAKELILALYKNAQEIKRFSLEEIFPE